MGLLLQIARDCRDRAAEMAGAFEQESGQESAHRSTSIGRFFWPKDAEKNGIENAGFVFASVPAGHSAPLAV
jgi:hypothetical protein